MLFTADYLRSAGASGVTIQTYFTVPIDQRHKMERMVLSALFFTNAITREEFEQMLERRQYMYRLEVTVKSISPEGDEYICKKSTQTFESHDEQLRHQGRYIGAIEGAVAGASMDHLYLDHPEVLEKIAEDNAKLAARSEGK